METRQTKFNRLKQWLTTRRLVKAALVLLLVGVAWVSLAYPAFSQNAPQQPGALQHGGGNVVQGGSFNAATNPGNYFTREWWIGLFASMLLYVAVLFIKVTLFALTFIIELAAYNGYLDATAVNVGWVMVRDITNMAFVVILLIIAFGTILGLEQYEWKKLLVKFVLAAILVNFSRLICGLLIDVSQLIMITFVNGIAATAGGNLINAFNLDRIVKIYSPPSVPELAAPGIFTAAVAAVVFAGMAMAVMFIFVFILVARLLGLWILIVLSPLAFVLSVIPKTQSFASRWWTEFGDRLVTGPVLLFFIWLSFVTVGTGDALGRDIDPYVDVPNKITPDGALEADKVGGQTLGIGDAMGWNKVANFAIAIGMLIAGAKVASEIGGSSGSALSGVASFGKKVATIASGYAVGRWLYGKGAGAVGAAVGAGAKVGKFALMDILPVRHYGQMVSRFGQRQWQSFGAWRNLTPGKRPKEEWNEKAGRWEAAKDAQGKIVYQDVKPKFAFIHGFFQKRVLERAGSIKKLEKTENFAKDREERLKRTVRGVPTGFFMADWEKVDGIDRFEHELLEVDKARSAAKTKDIAAQARAMYGQERRRQFDVDKGEWREAGQGATMQEEIERHNLNARTHEAQMQKIQAEAKLRVAMDTKAGQGLEQLRAIAAAQEAAAAKEAALKAREAETKFEVLKKPETEALIKERTEEEKRAHIMATEEEAVRKKAAAEFYRGTEGARELKRAAEIEREVKYYATEEERRKAEAAKVAAVSPFVKKTEEEALLKAAAEKETKEKEEAARREAAVAAGAPGGALERAARAEVRIAAEAARIKQEEETAKANAARLEKTALQEAKRAEVRTAVPEAERKRLEEAATVAARAKEDAALKETKRIELSRALDEARKKTQEEAAKASAATGMPLVLEMTKAEEFKAAEQTAITKEKEESAKAAAAKKEEATIRQTREAEVRAAAKTAEEKETEERAKAEAMRRQKPAVEAAEAAKLRMQEMEKTISEMQAKASQKAAEELPEVIKAISVAELGEQAAKSFIDKIKQEKLGNIFAKSADQLKEALKRMRLGRESFKDIQNSLTDPGARAAFAEASAAYFKDKVAGTAKDQATDTAESMVSFEELGIEIPPAAFKKVSKKQEEVLSTVEREKAVAMVADSMKKLMLDRKDGKKLNVAQEANFMAGIQFLTKRGWSDDLLARLTTIAKESARGEYAGQGRNEREGENIEQLLVDQLGWGQRKADGAVDVDNFENISSERRTNDLHRLLGFAGDANLLGAENAVLLNERVDLDTEGKRKGYESAVSSLAEKSMAALAATGGNVGQAVEQLLTTPMREAGAKLGWSEQRMRSQLETFVTTFAKGEASAGAAMTKFVEKIKDHAAQSEILTEQKQVGISTTHIDDAGHAIFDYKTNYAHGQLADDAMEFMRGDWVKADGGRKMRDLKSHALGDMDEEYGTLHNLDAKRVAATYAGIDSKVKLESQDVRVQRHLLKYNADEDLVKDEKTGALIVGASTSKLVKEKFGGGPEGSQKAEVDVARDWAVMLQNAPKAFLANLGINSGVGFEKGVQGKFKLKLFDKEMIDITELVGWINDRLDKPPVSLNDVRGPIQKLNARSIVDRAAVATDEEVVAKGGVAPEAFHDPMAGAIMNMARLADPNITEGAIDFAVAQFRNQVADAFAKNIAKAGPELTVALAAPIKEALAQISDKIDSEFIARKIADEVRSAVAKISKAPGKKGGGAKPKKEEDEEEEESRK